MFKLSYFFSYCNRNDILIIPYTGMPAAGATVRDLSGYGIFLDFSKIQTGRQFRGICAHELGHASTGALHKVDSPFETVERSEYRANRWSAENFLTAEDFKQAFANGYTEPWELAEYFDLPEADVLRAFAYWRDCRGIAFDAT